MLLIRDIMYCKPGKVRPMVEKFLLLSKLSEKVGMPRMRIMTDVSAERYWTVVAEMEVSDLKVLDDMSRGMGMNDADRKAFEDAMRGYHDLVESGRREIYKLEG
jgi:hypothetical protein